ncbi:class I SAM-dependent methyltransferase [Massilia litorea]|uniref:Methyltransferase domain-containing protein n=1 Tax=Massilia litorea TaxID=2769491 RepID=A0A7L9U8U9_9BURK|nr:class I SAM-dependent methyltransferase [Massilia litorea]QOL51481.1 methyltransferase domain-containing protein [Massilia litorea]
MERLEFGGASRYVAIEAAIHIARYLTAKEHCADRKVLDIACGEGYGSWLMAEWGAQSVLGVDVSSKAIASADKRFSNERVRFAVSPGEQLTRIISDQKFNLIVSLETIEHVDDPQLFLENIRDAAAPNATIIISAPNDYWYYDLGGQNEFHKRRFTFEEFQVLAESVLGKADSWNLGTLGIGFSVAEQGGKLPSGDATTPLDAMLEFQPIDSAVYVPSQIESDVTPAEAAFYVGVWGAEAKYKTIFAGYPVSMNLGRQILFPRDGMWATKPDPLSHASDVSTQRSVAKEGEAQKPQNAHSRERALIDEIDSLTAALLASKEQLEQAKSREVAINNKLSVLTDSVANYSEKLHFTEMEVERLGMSRRAAQAEVAVAWRAIYRHEHAASEMQARLDAVRGELELARNERELARNELESKRNELELARNELESKRSELELERNELESKRSELELARSELELARQQLSQMPWKVIRTWWLIRKAIPTPLLHRVGTVLSSILRRNAR